MKVALRALFLGIVFPAWLGAMFLFSPGGKVQLSPGAQIRIVPTPVSTLIYGDVTATMTSDTEPSPNVATLSADPVPIFGSGFGAYKGFDGNESTFLALGDTVNTWIKYDFGSEYPNPIVLLRLRGRVGVQTKNPKNIVLQGSNDDATWDDLKSAQMAQEDTWQSFSFTNTAKYRYYRITIDQSWDSTYPQLAEIQLWEQPE